MPCPRGKAQDDPPQSELKLLYVARSLELLLRTQNFQFRHIAEVHRKETLRLLRLLDLALWPSSTCNDFLFLFGFRVVIALLIGHRNQLGFQLLLGNRNHRDFDGLQFRGNIIRRAGEDSLHHGRIGQSQLQANIIGWSRQRNWFLHR